ncbi:HigA family addiction module antitoxin [Crocosphaera sp. XPORK-15E]|uniref:HigA family addiction module antitoxin n=1 Tax=Crocosphaera sp. XPORK-15E TaxID=3110247 RepID=UPI002B1F1DD9|nr:HigA family addiction module antitoxin [Crocosphaera sp. XPORK-15E]MEA5533970.1 HigA family addiction module antitoxin [Crocosphaera sp. XPORK-15E]
MNNSLLYNPHAGEILKHEFLEELNIRDDDLAKSINVSPVTITEIINGKIPITADIDLRLCQYFQLSEGYFLRLQNAYDLMEAKRMLGDTLTQIIPLAD